MASSSLLFTAAFGVGSTQAASRGVVCMAVPKKRTSKMKKRIRRAVWYQKARVAGEKALALGKSVLTGRSNSFYYETDEPAPPSDSTTTSCTHGDYAITEEEMRELMLDNDVVSANPVKPTGLVARMQLGRIVLLQILARHVRMMVAHLTTRVMGK